VLFFALIAAFGRRWAIVYRRLEELHMLTLIVIVLMRLRLVDSDCAVSDLRLIS